MTRLISAVQGAVTQFAVAGVLVAGAVPLDNEPRVSGVATTSFGTFDLASSPASRSNSPAAQSFPSGEPLTVTSRCGGPNDAPSAAQLNAGLANFRVPGWKWADGGVSAPLSDGRVVWLFGDTGREPTEVYSPGMSPNSMLISRGGCFDQAQSSGGKPVLPDVDGTVKPDGVWPTAVVALNHGVWDEVLVFGVVVHRTGGFWGFQLGPTTLTRFVIPTGGVPRRVDQRQLTESTFSESNIDWGAGVVRVGPMLYLYGTQRVAGQLGRALYLARVPVSEVANQNLWQYRAGDGWTAQSSAAAPVIPATQGVSHIVGTYTSAASQYVISKVGGDFGDDIGIWRADDPAGRFALVATYRRPYHRDSSVVEYMPLAHPELGTDSGLVVSMSRNLPMGISNGDDDAQRPDFFTVPAP